MWQSFAKFIRTKLCENNSVRKNCSLNDQFDPKFLKQLRPFYLNSNCASYEFKKYLKKRSKSL